MHDFSVVPVVEPVLLEEVVMELDEAMLELETNALDELATTAELDETSELEDTTLLELATVAELELETTVLDELAAATELDEAMLELEVTAAHAVTLHQ